MDREYEVPTDPMDREYEVPTDPMDDLQCESCQ